VALLDDARWRGREHKTAATSKMSAPFFLIKRLVTVLALLSVHGLYKFGNYVDCELCANPNSTLEIISCQIERAIQEKEADSYTQSSYSLHMNTYQTGLVWMVLVPFVRMRRAR